MKKNIGKGKMLFAILAVAIIILASFTVITQFQLNDLVSSKEDKLSVIVFADTDGGVTPLTVNFSSIAFNYEGNLEYHWEFGDGETSNEKKPTHTYYHIEINESDDIELNQKSQKTTYVCKLTVEDETGTKTTDQIVIDALANRPPSISLKIDPLNPRRPFVPLIEFAPKLIRIDNYASEDYWWLLTNGLLPKSLTSKDGFLTVSASATDPDGDEIVSYEWTLYPPSYNTRRGEPENPEFNYTGQTVVIPIEDLYPAVQYNLKLVVTDSAGQSSEENVGFKVSKSNQKSKVETIVQQISYYISKWVSEWHTSLIMSTIILGILIRAFRVLKELPLTQLLTMIFIKVILQTDPNEYTEYENLMGPLKVLTDKRPWVNNSLNTWTQNLQDNYTLFANQFARFFFESNRISKEDLGKITMEDFREYLCFENERPKIIEPTSPENNEDNIPLNTANLWVDIHDSEDDRFDVSIYCDYINTSYHYMNFTNVNNSYSPFNASLKTPLDPRTPITWKVTIKEQDYPEEIYTTEFKFTTGFF